MNIYELAATKQMMLRYPMVPGKNIGYVHFGTVTCGPNVYPVGKSQNKDGHILVVGGSQTGKSSCIAIPTLSTWKGPIFAIDIKGELFEAWSKYTEEHDRPAKCFEFTSEEGALHYDPFYRLREGDPNDLVQNARELAQAIIPVPSTVQDPFWSQAAQNILTGLFLYVCGLCAYDESTGQIVYGSFNMAMEMLQSMPVWELIHEIGESDNILAKMHISQYQKIEYPAENKMLAGIGAELSNRVMTFATDSRIRAAFTTGDHMLRWENLEHTTVFLRIPEDKLDQWDRAITLMLTQLIRTLERRPDQYSPEGKENNLPPLLLLLDEFPRLGKIEVIQNALSTLRSKGVTICLIVQSIAQFDKTYGQAVRKIILDNCSYKAILGVMDPENQRMFSDMIGTTLREQYSVTQAINQNISSPSQKGTIHASFSREYEVFPHELSTLNDILLLSPNGFCRVEKRPYYQETQKNTPPRYVEEHTGLFQTLFCHQKDLLNPTL